MSTTPSRASDGETLNTSQDLNSPTYASFSPASLSHVPTSTRQRSSILVHQKSPLLVATPPQITRALAYSHPFLLPLNKLAGLLSWTSGDAWESFLLLALFWAVVIYGDLVIRWGAPLVVVAALILGMYSRRYSPLSSTGRPGGKSKMSKKKKRSSSADEGPERHQKSLDEIVETLNAFTARCNVLLEPLLRLTDFLSTQQSATSATTRPALTTLFIRILMLSPIWLFLTLSPLRLVTTRAVVLAVGTVLISWHSRPARVSRAILWRSMLVRQLCSTVTGLSFGDAAPPPSFTDPNCEPPSLPSRSPSYNKATASIDTKLGPGSTGVRFTFILYENQRRWIGLGWTQSLFAYERAAWSDERLNPAPTKDDFELPEVEGGNARWRWIDGSEWRVEGAVEGEEGGAKGVKNAKGTGGGGWIYYDNKVRLSTVPQKHELTLSSGEMAVGIKTVGAATPDDASGTETPSWLRSRRRRRGRVLTVTRQRLR